VEKICSPKRRFELEIHSTKSQKASLIDSTVKASQRTVFFHHKLYPSMERLINSDSTVTQLWNPIILRNPEEGDDTFSKYWFDLELHSTKSQKASINKE
jgi:hypothetical protein